MSARDFRFNTPKKFSTTTRSDPVRAKHFCGFPSIQGPKVRKLGQIGIRITAEAGAQDTGLASVVEPLAEFVPLLAIDATQISAAGWMLPGGHGGDQACLTAQYDRRRGGLAPAR